MTRRIAVLAAMPSELQPLVHGWKRLPTQGNVSLWTHRDEEGDEVVAACAGMGEVAARRAFLAACSGGALDLVLNVGLAGATTFDKHVAEVLCVSEVIDVRTGERFFLTEADRRLRLATTPGAADAREKARLTASYGVQLVDMEAATVARLARMREVPMCCFKVVSDAADADLPKIDRYLDAEGQFQTLRFVTAMATKPRYWRSIASLARNSRAASRALAKELERFLVHKDWAYTNATGDFNGPKS